MAILGSSSSSPWATHFTIGLRTIKCLLTVGPFTTVASFSTFFAARGLKDRLAGLYGAHLNVHLV